MSPTERLTTTKCGYSRWPKGKSRIPASPGIGDDADIQKIIILGKRPLRMDYVPSYTEARDYWRHGDRRPIRVPTSAVDFHNFRVSSVPNGIRVMKLLEKDGTTDSGWKSHKDDVAFETTRSDYPTLGDITLKVEGKLSRTGDEFRFSGTIKAFDDPYDFNSDWSRPARNIITVGARVDHGPGTAYDIQFEGAVDVDRTIK